MCVCVAGGGGGGGYDSDVHDDLFFYDSLSTN